MRPYLLLFLTTAACSVPCETPPQQPEPTVEQPVCEHCYLSDASFAVDKVIKVRSRFSVLFEELKTVEKSVTCNTSLVMSNYNRASYLLDTAQIIMLHFYQDEKLLHPMEKIYSVLERSLELFEFSAGSLESCGINISAVQQEIVEAQLTLEHIKL